MILSPADLNLVDEGVKKRMDEYQDKEPIDGKLTPAERLRIAITGEIAFREYIGLPKDHAVDGRACMVALRWTGGPLSIAVKTWASAGAGLRLFIPSREARDQAGALATAVLRSPSSVLLHGFIYTGDFLKNSSLVRMGDTNYRWMSADDLMPMHVLYLSVNGPKCPAQTLLI